MSGLVRSALASAMLLLSLTSPLSAQCVGGEEVCLESDTSVGSVEQQLQASSDDVTTDTYTEEQAALVAQITLNLKRRNLTRPRGNNANEQIQRLKELHPLHDYSVNGSKYIARIMMVLGRKSLREGNLALATQRLQQAIEFDPQVKRQSELKAGIATAEQNGSADDTPADESTADESTVGDGKTDKGESGNGNPVVTEPGKPDPPEADKTAQVSRSIEAVDQPVKFSGKVTTETFTDEQTELVEGITRDLERRRLHEPLGDNAFEKIRRLKEIHPAHDYSVNGTNYIARILMLLGRKALSQGDLERASQHMLKAIQFNPEVERQDELKKQIADAAKERAKERARAREVELANQLNTEQNTKTATGQSAPAVSYLQSDSTTAILEEPSSDIEFVAPVMVAIPAGSFMMGSESGADDEKPVHNVVIDAFSMSKHEITLQQYRVFALATGRPVPQYLPEESTLPATYVSWRDAVAYTEWLSKKTRKLFRLPTESEWEYAARAGTTTDFFTGETLVNAANCVGCGGQWAGQSLAPVGSFDPNEFGLYDTHGNVWEWVQDCWTDNYSGRTESSAAVEQEGCERHVLRGGAWYNDSSYARVSYRGNERVFFRDGGVGFRVVYEGL